MAGQVSYCPSFGSSLSCFTRQTYVGLLVISFSPASAIIISRLEYTRQAILFAYCSCNYFLPLHLTFESAKTVHIWSLLVKPAGWLLNTSLLYKGLKPLDKSVLACHTSSMESCMKCVESSRRLIHLETSYTEYRCFNYQQVGAIGEPHWNWQPKQGDCSCCCCRCCKR